MHPEFSSIIQRITDETGNELKGEEVYEVFSREYLDDSGPYSLVGL